ncbi:hypothetical protein RHMOL_Rhmol01G0226800 [Rhododendron molle]|uniref:Uncharacterized protein n=1 Tax=Rhododendron molle TaxID=49168 RepID=A0ACC0Q6D3_RHOML|nr:hypothetical protein RHMOL_Rhmol01G0226800 [Rhododendron molle]
MSFPWMKILSRVKVLRELLSIVTEIMDRIDEKVILNFKGNSIKIKVAEKHQAIVSKENKLGYMAVDAFSLRNGGFEIMIPFLKKSEEEDGMALEVTHELENPILVEEGEKQPNDERVVEGVDLDLKIQIYSLRVVESVVGDTCSDSISGDRKSNVAVEDGEIVAENITPILGVSTEIHDPGSDVRLIKAFEIFQKWVS